MAQLTIQTTDRTGTSWSVSGNKVAAAAGGDYFANSGSELLFVENTSGGSITLTEVFGVNATLDGVTPTSKTVVVANNKQLLLGPYPTQLYNDANGNMQLTYSGAGLTVQVVLPGTT